jgi:hypothetical protein
VEVVGMQKNHGTATRYPAIRPENGPRAS